MQKDGTLLDLAAAVADGSDVDWDRAVSTAQNADERQVLQQLKILADVGSAARASGMTWGPLEIRGELGVGTFGTVFRAWDVRLERDVALKLLHERCSEGALASTVVKEGRLLAQIRHANVVTVHGADVFDRRAGIWMEFVSGRTLRAIVEEQGPFGHQEAAVIGRDLCRALAAVHQRGIVHRDIKAQNVMREAGGRTVLMDFGTGDAAAALGSAPLAGTPAYLAPEVLAGEAPTYRSDLYSLGVLMFYLVSGDFPVTGASLDELRERHGRHQRRLLRDLRPDLPASFVRVIDRTTAADPAERPESAGATEALLGGVLELSDLDATGPFRAFARLFEGTNKTARWIVLAVVLAGVALASVLWSPTTADSPSVVARNSVAVLAFRNVDGAGQETDYFSRGITDDLVAQLSSIRDLRVISGTSVRRFDNGKASPVEVGAELGAATVLDGTVQRTANRIQITSRLVDAHGGQVLWSETFDRDLDDIFSLQSDISRRIAYALRGELLRTDSASPVAPKGRDFEAFDAYLKGREQWRLRTEEGLSRSLQYFQDAIARDPTYALAHAGMADAYTLMGMYGVLPRSYAFSRASTSAQRAVELSDSAEGHAALGYVQKNRFEWAAAERSFKRAIQLKPGYAPARHWYAIYLTQHGRFPEAIGEIKIAISLDPLSTGANAQFASVLMMARRYDDAIAQFQKTLQLDAGFPAYASIAQAYTYKGLYDDAYKAAGQASQRAPVGSENQPLKADLGYLYAVSGRKADALAIARELAERRRRTDEEVAVNIAVIHAGLSDADSAIKWLTEAHGYGDLELGYLKVEPRWDSIRDDKRFTALLESLGFTR
jgi:eukaryotic-like serine/threonine-protein kinase